LGIDGPATFGHTERLFRRYQSQFVIEMHDGSRAWYVQQPDGRHRLILPTDCPQKLRSDALIGGVARLLAHQELGSECGGGLQSVFSDAFEEAFFGLRPGLLASLYEEAVPA
jgi:hypothetical protein